MYCFCVCSKSLDNEETLAHWGVLRHGEVKTFNKVGDLESEPHTITNVYYDCQTQLNLLLTCRPYKLQGVLKTPCSL